MQRTTIRELEDGSRETVIRRAQFWAPPYGSADAAKDVDIGQIVEAALSRMDLPSHASLAGLLRISPTALSEWIKGSRTPTEEHMIKLCDFAGIDPDDAMIMAALLRSKGGDKKLVWKHIWSLVVAAKSTAAALIALLALSLIPAAPGTDGAQAAPYNRDLSIMRQRLWRLIAEILGIRAAAPGNVTGH